MLPSMYAKLFSRIAQSSLMEQDVETRYCFMMLLAIADSGGDVIGTDVALARSINLPLDTFKRCVASLMEPDPDSNSQVHDGRRLVPSESGRGYLVVNYVTYRTIKTAEEKKTYMREYMRKYRKPKNDKDVTSVNVGKEMLTVLGQAEGEGESDGKREETNPKTQPARKRARSACAPLDCPAFLEFWTAYPKKEAKADAEKAWIKHDCVSKLPLILTVIRAWKPKWQSEPKYIPLPATWLNRRGWEDEISTPINGSSPLPPDPPEWRDWLKGRNEEYVPHAKAMAHYREAFEKR